MNDELKNYARQSILKGLSQCTSEQVLFFKKMYSHDDLTRNIEDVVKTMPESKLDWAMQQVQRTITKAALKGDTNEQSK